MGSLIPKYDQTYFFRFIVLINFNIDTPGLNLTLYTYWFSYHRNCVSKI